MRPILVVFESRYGQSAKIGRWIEHRLHARGHVVDLEQSPGARPIPIREYAGVIIVAPVYNRHHPASIERFVHQYARSLADVPTAFVSVSFAARARLAFVRSAVQKVSFRLFRSAGWTPSRLAFVGGRIDYPIYTPAMTRAVHASAFVFGLPTDTTRAHELTNWDELADIADSVVTDVEETENPNALATLFA